MAKLNNWSFNFDLRDVPSPSQKAPIATEGYYKGQIVSASIDTERNANRVEFLVKVLEGDQAGAMCRDSMMLPGSTERDNRVYWRGLFESMSVNPQQLNQQAVNVQDAGAIFVGKTVVVYFKPGNRDLGTWNKMLFLNPTVWQSQKSRFEASDSVTPTATVQQTPAPQPAAPAQVAPQAQAVPQATAGFANNVSSNDILNMLQN